MTESSVHAFTEWAKSRLDEMEATITSMQAKAKELEEEARQQASDAVAEAERWYDVFATNAKKLEEYSKSAFVDAQDAWDKFEAGVDRWTAAAKGEREAFDARAEALINAWQDTIDNYAKLASEVSADQRERLSATIQRLEEEAQAARGRLDALRETSVSSWPAIKDALEESRTAFENAANAFRAEFDKARRSGK